MNFSSWRPDPPWTCSSQEGSLQAHLSPSSDNALTGVLNGLILSTCGSISHILSQDQYSRAATQLEWIYFGGFLGILSNIEIMPVL